MPYICNKCYAKYGEHIEVCDKCGGFSISLLKDEDVHQIFQDNFNSSCGYCGHVNFGTASLVQSRTAKIVYISGLASSLIFIFGLLIMWVSVLHIKTVPLGLIFLMGSLPSIICFSIGNSMKKQRGFNCSECGTENTIYKSYARLTP
jgi:hypothetical protein